MLHSRQSGSYDLGMCRVAVNLAQWCTFEVGLSKSSRLATHAANALPVPSARDDLLPVEEN